MALSLDDVKYFDGKFGEVHDKLNGQRNDLTELKSAYSSHFSNRCQNVKAHEDTHHVVGLFRQMALYAAVSAVVGAVVGVLSWFATR